MFLASIADTVCRIGGGDDSGCVISIACGESPSQRMVPLMSVMDVVARAPDGDLRIPGEPREAVDGSPKLTGEPGVPSGANLILGPMLGPPL